MAASVQTVNTKPSNSASSRGAAQAHARDRDAAGPPDANEAADGTTVPSPSSLNVAAEQRILPSCSRPFSRPAYKPAIRNSNMAPSSVPQDMQGSLQLQSSSPQALGSTHIYSSAAATTSAEVQVPQPRLADFQPPQAPVPATDGAFRLVSRDAAVGQAHHAQLPHTSQTVLTSAAGPMQFLQVPQGQLLMAPAYVPLLQPSIATSIYATLQQLPQRLQPAPDAVLSNARKRYGQASGNIMIRRHCRYQFIHC